MTGKGQQGHKGGATKLEAANLACERGGRLLFKGLNFALGPGDALMLTGPNGVGKSSLLRVIAGLLPALSGQINKAGRAALADEHLALDPRLPLARALSFWARLDGSDVGDIDQALTTYDLTRLAGVPVRMLSTGQRRRATLARVHASQAEIWLLDEPGNGLDQSALRLLEQAMGDHRAKGGIILLATHQPLDLPGADILALEATR